MSKEPREIRQFKTACAVSGHCYCKLVFVQPIESEASTTSGIRHNECCICGHRKLVGEEKE